MGIVAVETEADYVGLLAEIDRIAESESEDIDLLRALIELVAEYELRCFPPEPGDKLSTCPWHRKVA